MPEPTVEQDFASAVQYHQAARLSEAERLYRRVLARQPNHADALHLLGVLGAQIRRFGDAVELIGRAIALNPRVPEYYANFANALMESGQLDRAISAYGSAIRLKPGFAEAHKNLGIALKDKGMLDEAIKSHRRAIAIDPAYALAHGDLGYALAAKGEIDQAILSYRESLRLNPANPQVWNNLGIVLADKNLLSEAVAAYRESVRLKPEHEAMNNLANALAKAGRLDEAVPVFHDAIRLKPNSPDIWSNLGLILREAGRLDEAIEASSYALQMVPEMPYPHWNIAQALLQKGDYERGWPEYEWRWRWKDFPSPRRNFAQPQWRGEPLNRRTILLHTEQGLGDIMQFVRYAPLVAARGGRVLLETPRSMALLFQSLPDVELVFSDQPLPSFDVHCPLMSLPLAFGTRLDTVPATVPYFHVAPGVAETWGKKLGPRTGRLRVGLAWAGNPKQVVDTRRSITLSHLSPLSKVPGVTFYSLQKGYAAAQTANPPPGMELIDLTGEIEDFADTAALISHLDLVISTCTSIAHLSGALGKKTWTLLAHLPDWRWMLGRDDSPWYPTMRLFRQTAPGDWAGVMGRVADALERRE
jgi:tetratricopeptide (TPR) repeat protein